MKKSAITLESSLAPLIGTMLEALTPVAPSDKSQRAMKSDLMHKVAATKRAIKPTVVRNALHADAASWIRVTSKIDCQVLFDNGNTSAHLVRFAAGAVSPGHRHEYDEAAFVMSGWCVVGDIRLNTGDYHMVPKGASHDDIVSPEGCILFLHGPSYTSPPLESAHAAARA